VGILGLAGSRLSYQRVDPDSWGSGYGSQVEVVPEASSKWY